MSTLGEMKQRISDTISRPDLLAKGAIEKEIKSAIQAYRGTRFWFNEKRSRVVFDTVVGQSEYTSADHADIPNLVRIDYITVNYLNREVPQKLVSPEQMEYLLGQTPNSNGEPYCYSYYEQALRFYRPPAGIYPVRVAGVIRLAAPASDDEADNSWMTDGEELIRLRAESRLWGNWMGDLATGQAIGAQERSTLDDLGRETSSRTQVSTIKYQDL